MAIVAARTVRLTGVVSAAGAVRASGARRAASISSAGATGAVGRRGGVGTARRRRLASARNEEIRENRHADPPHARRLRARIDPAHQAFVFLRSSARRPTLAHPQAVSQLAHGGPDSPRAGQVGGGSRPLGAMGAGTPSRRSSFGETRKQFRRSRPPERSVHSSA
jgi:hypothetical protein